VSIENSTSFMQPNKVLLDLLPMHDIMSQFSKLRLHETVYMHSLIDWPLGPILIVAYVCYYERVSHIVPSYVESCSSLFSSIN
jgi:hypothetical protein